MNDLAQEVANYSIHRQKMMVEEMKEALSNSLRAFSRATALLQQQDADWKEDRNAVEKHQGKEALLENLHLQSEEAKETSNLNVDAVDKLTTLITGVEKSRDAILVDLQTIVVSMQRSDSELPTGSLPRAGNF